MFKFTTIVVLALAICVAADPIRQKPLRRRVLARQEVLPTPAPTGYPVAGVTPEIPFELPTETEHTDFVTQQPDEVYGPPEFDAKQPDEAEVQKPDEVYGPPETQQPDEVYGPPEADATPEIIEEVEEEADEETDAEEVAEDLDEEVVVDENTFEAPARLVAQRFPQRRRLVAVPARLTKAKVVKPVNFVYTARFQTFPQK
ncbi:uncharacterized protein LOC119599684 [Lucilia sericata]|uniref:uncharacterized protein LOC119599684 n=1 Tax=Lucilia sericata TaxID=13632 RepID=UPI0018A86607|nr:uncharacterized protein LOC119599684 [Lucilia sericata]